MNRTRRSKKLFKDPDPEEARQFIKDYFFNQFLPEDNPARDDDENAAREVMFNKLTELESVVRDLKKRIKRG